MKYLTNKVITLSILLMLPVFQIKGNDTLKYSMGFSAYLDFSDSYGSGRSLSGEFKILYKCCGIGVSLNHFYSISNYILSIPAEYTDKSVLIPTTEVAVIGSGDIYFIIEPLKTKFLSIDLLFGTEYARVRLVRLNALNFSYSFLNEQFTYLYRDYKLFGSNYFHCMIGLDLKFKLSRNLTFDVKSRIIQSKINNSFFLLGAGFGFYF